MIDTSLLAALALLVGEVIPETDDYRNRSGG